MKTYTAKSEILAESYINGNISYVKKAIQRSSALALQTYQKVKEMAGEEKADMFLRTMGE